MKCTTKEIQVALKVSQKRIESLNFSHRLGFEDYVKEQIGLFRRQCKNIKLRHIYYKLTFLYMSLKSSIYVTPCHFPHYLCVHYLLRIQKYPVNNTYNILRSCSITYKCHQIPIRKFWHHEEIKKHKKHLN